MSDNYTAFLKHPVYVTSNQLVSVLRGRNKCISKSELYGLKIDLLIYEECELHQTLFLLF